MLESPKSLSESPQDSTLPPTHDLPSRATARRLCHNAIYDACCLMRFVHEPSFFALFDRIYDTPPEQFGNEENAFLPLLYIVMAVGCLFSDDGAGTLDKAGYESAINQGYVVKRAMPLSKLNVLQISILQGRSTTVGDYRLPRLDVTTSDLLHGAFPAVFCEAEHLLFLRGHCASFGAASRPPSLRGRRFQPG